MVFVLGGIVLGIVLITGLVLLLTIMLLLVLEFLSLGWNDYDILQHSFLISVSDAVFLFCFSTANVCERKWSPCTDHRPRRNVRIRQPHRYFFRYYILHLDMP